jgi:hypothetical protein
MVDHLCLSDNFDRICSMDHVGGFGENMQEEEIVSKQLGKTETTEGCATCTVAEFLAIEANVEWRDKFTRIEKNHLTWLPFHQNSSVWAFFRLNEGIMD